MSNIANDDCLKSEFEDHNQLKVDLNNPDKLYNIYN